MYDLGLRLREIRVQRGITQEALGRRINKSKSAICSYETNAQIPPLDVLISIASVLNVSLDQLAGFDSGNSISIKSLTDQQQQIIEMLLAEFTNPSNSSNKISLQQTQIIQELILVFSGYYDET